MITHARGERTAAVAALILTVILTTACQGGSTSPSAPTGIAVDRDGPTIVTISIESDRAARLSDHTIPFTATARLSDGSVQDITPIATWRSSNPAVATVEAGLVRLLDSGEVTLSAAYRGAVGTLHVSVTVFRNAAAVVPIKSTKRNGRG
jgi:hypothetical protein